MLPEYAVGIPRLQAREDVKNDRFLVAHAFVGAIVSRLCTSANLAEHIVHSVDDCLRLIQLNLVVRSLDESMYASRGEVCQGFMLGEPVLQKGLGEPYAGGGVTPGVLRREHNEGHCAKAEMVDAVVPMCVSRRHE